MIRLELCPNSELSKISEMAEIIWKDYYIEFLPVEQIDYMLNRFYSQSALVEQVEKGQRFYIIEEDNEELGFVSISKKEDNEFFINKFYLNTILRRKSNGSKVFKILIEMFAEESNNNPFKIRLTVNRQNYKAINFYFKNGFTIESVEDFDIKNGYFMHDFVMIKTVE